jgi:aquaporin Z
MREPTMLHRLAVEFIGTFWLVLGGCGSAVFAAKFGSDGVSVGIGFLGVSLAFGLTVLTGVYAFGATSGGHFNPAVTLGAALARRVEWKALPGYWIVQVIGGLVAGLVIYLIAKSKDGWTAWRPMAMARTSRRLLAVGGDPRRGDPDRGLPAHDLGLHR